MNYQIQGWNFKNKVEGGGTETEECVCVREREGEGEGERVLGICHNEERPWKKGVEERNVGVWWQAYWHGALFGHTLHTELLHLLHKKQTPSVFHTHHTESSFYLYSLSKKNLLNPSNTHKNWTKTQFIFGNKESSKEYYGQRKFLGTLPYSVFLSQVFQIDMREHEEKTGGKGKLGL